MRTRTSVVIGFLSVSMAAATAGAVSVTFSATGANTTDIQTSVDSFRTSLGALNPNVAGSFGSGRREINWDGVPDGSSAPNALPANFFNVNSPRGVVFSDAASFQVSANLVNPTSTGTQFDNFNNEYHRFFEPFSAQRLFTSVGTTGYDVTFFVPGSTAPATTRGFGAVLSDADLANTSSIEYFDASNASLGKFFAPATVGQETYSFLGVDFLTPQVARVHVVLGNAALASGVADQNGNPNDLVVADDFVYGEPIGVPEPATMLAPLAIAFVASRRRRGR